MREEDYGDSSSPRLKAIWDHTRTQWYWPSTWWDQCVHVLSLLSSLPRPLGQMQSCDWGSGWAGRDMLERDKERRKDSTWVKPATKELIFDEKWIPRPLTGQGHNQCPRSVGSPADEEGEFCWGEYLPEKLGMQFQETIGKYVLMLWAKNHN